VAVLIVTAADAHVGQAGVFDLVEACHRTNSRTPDGPRFTPMLHVRTRVA
jgi:hypothetical protein